MITNKKIELYFLFLYNITFNNEQPRDPRPTTIV